MACRGGECGNRTKHPGFDQRGQLRELRDALGSANVVVSTCLDACEHANVVVALPGADGRDIGGGPVWVGGVNDAEVTHDLARWIADGGPGLVDEPTLVAIGTFVPTRLSRHELAWTLGDA